MASYRNRKVTVKLTEQEYAENSRFLSHWETRTMSRLIRRALYDYRKAQIATAKKPDEVLADQTDQANAKKLTDSMSSRTPAKRGPVPGKKRRPGRQKAIVDKSDKSTAALSTGFKPGIRRR